MGTNPQNPNSKIWYTLSQNGSDIQIQFPTVAGRTYAVRYQGSLGSPWQTVQGDIPGTGGIVTVTDPNAATQTQRFYHVKVQMP